VVVVLRIFQVVVPVDKIEFVVQALVAVMLENCVAMVRVSVKVIGSNVVQILVGTNVPLVT
tara:strand:- start:268 stop:450 length:183 start_codon:yes stop_codon:yes gene_type:complete